jgi:hypothetical protein
MASLSRLMSDGHSLPAYGSWAACEGQQPVVFQWLVKVRLAVQTGCWLCKWAVQLSRAG